ncbi:MAG: hypothetical protein Q4G68_14525 [Planctomycetia bacterium]|nr:hypothetical protein [Planctomycetia bacterium]
MMKKQMMKRVSCLVLMMGLCLLVSFGCGQARPEGMPELVSCTLVLTQEGKPLDGAQVQLVPKAESERTWSVGGVTDAAGTVQVQTHGLYRGAPKGTFAVVVTKTRSEGGRSGNEHASGGMQTRNAVIYTLIDKQYTDSRTTPLEITIQGKTKETLELGPAVKEIISSGDDA